MKLLQIENLVKNYGTFEAVKSISFGIEKGEIFGLIGPNGAGKTTTLRIISTLIGKTSGKVKLGDYEVGKSAPKFREMLSYLPEEAGVYKNLKGREYLKFIAAFQKDKKKQKSILEKGVKIANLGKRIDEKVSSYSKGMTRRLVIARALMTDPVLAILDEPTSGLDVMNAHEIRKIIKESAKDGAVLLSSHNMLEVEYLCDRIALINKGKIVETGTPDELKEKYQSVNVEEIFMKIVEDKEHAN